MIITVNNKDYDIDLSTSEGHEKIQEFALTRNFEKVPFLNTLAVANTKIKDYTELHAITLEEARLKIEQMVAENQSGIKTTSNIAFTAFNPLDSFFYIYVNYSKLDTDPRFNVEFISFIYLHQVCHNYFGHFTRPVITEYRNRNAAITELVLDAQVNTFLFNALRYNNSSNGYIKQTKDLINQEYPTYDKLYALLAEKYNVIKNFNTAIEFPPVESVLRDCEPLFQDPNYETVIQSLGVTMDSHNASQELVYSVAAEMNQDISELNNIQASSMEYLQSAAKQQGIGMSDAEARQIESLFTKKSVLEVIKLTKTLKQASRIKYKKTWQKINRHRQYSEDIFMMGKKPTQKLHLIVGVDVSGSVSDDELKMIYSHLKTFVRDKGDEVCVDVFFWSSGTIVPERDLIQDIAKNKIDGFKPYSYGGTQLEYADEFIRQQYKEKKIIFVNITDGWFSPVNLDPDIVDEHYAILTVRDMEDRITKDFANKTVPIKSAVTIRNERSNY